MWPEEIATLLHKSIQHMPHVICEYSLRHDIDELTHLSLPATRLAVVMDTHTGEALGRQVAKALESRFQVTRIELAAPLVADDNAASLIERRMGGAEALVAVGSGAVNDLCKYVSHKLGLPYAVFPTAASMNGYVSANASITIDGYKQTLPAHLPVGVFCDLSVIAAAPARLSRSGFGDSMARPTAQADWLLSHLTLSTAYDETPFALLTPFEPELLAEAKGIGAGDTESIRKLMRVLLLSGFGMTIAGGSYPASQGEHMIAHAYEMLTPSHAGTLHGEEIAVTTLYMASLQQNLLRARPPLNLPPFPKDALEQALGAQRTKKAIKAYAEKTALAGSRDIAWDAVAEAVERISMPPQFILSALEAAGCPVRPEALGWDTNRYRFAAQHARYLRERFTFLDMELA